MRLAILSRKKSLYATRRLLEAAAGRGHEALVLDPAACSILCDGRTPALEPRVGPVDAVVPRIGGPVSDYSLAVVRQFETAGVPVLNGANAIAHARDKLLSLQLLSRSGIAIPRTVLARNPAHLPAALRLVGGPPVVLKLLQGSQGIGVMLAETSTALESVLHTLWSLGQNILIQEFVAESRGRDLRVLVVGKRVVAAMRRTARDGDFRSNLHRGGEGRAVRLSPAHERLALDAVRVLGLEVAGVDMLESCTGPKVLEINSSPGFEGLERVSGLDIAGAIVDHAAERWRATVPERSAL